MPRPLDPSAGSSEPKGEPARRARRGGVRSAFKAMTARVVSFGSPASPGLSARPTRTVPVGYVGWDPVFAPVGSSHDVSPPERPDAAIDDSIVAAAQRIVAGHVPGRGLHVVGAGIGGDPAVPGHLIALARSLAEKGRSVIVDLDTMPGKLAPLSATRDAETAMMRLRGLAELLAGEASFAEVIHRDHATRLHFIPTGRKDADFRDFDLILDALTETYDFVILLTPTLPRSDIAKVMAPYADYVVLTAGGSADAEYLDAIQRELKSAGARDILIIGSKQPNRAARSVA